MPDFIIGGEGSTTTSKGVSGGTGGGPSASSTTSTSSAASSSSSIPSPSKLTNPTTTNTNPTASPPSNLFNGASFRALVNQEGSLPSSHSPSEATWSAGGTSKLIQVIGGQSPQSQSKGKGKGLAETSGGGGGGGGAVVFEGVFLNGLCSLRRLEIRNVSKGVVVVRLGSTLGDQLQYQLTNFNLDLLPTELRHLATNTSLAAAHLGDIPESNALFDSVGFVRELTLQPGQTREIVVSFRPDSTHALPTPVFSNDFTPYSSTNSNANTNGNGNGRAESQSEQGLSSVSIAEDSNVSSSVGGGARWSDHHNGPTNGKQQYDLVTIDGFLNFDASLLPPGTSPTTTSGTTTTTTSGDGGPTPIAFQQLSLDLHATCCRSLFTLSIAKANDPSEVFIDWGNQCVVGELYTRDFELVNRSGIELFWRLEDPAGIATGRNSSAPFLVTDKDKGHWLGAAGSEWPRPQSVAPHSTRKLRFIFKPTLAGEIDVEFSFENMSDLDNTVSIHFHASVISAPRDDNLRLLSGTSIDYGDCCSGEVSTQVIVFKNVADHPLEVAFAGDKGHDVTFKLEVAGELEAARRMSLLDGGDTIDANSEHTPAPLVALARSSQTSSFGTNEGSQSSSSSSAHHSRTIISELARSTTLSSLPSPLRGASLLAGNAPRSHSSLVPIDASVSSNQSDSAFSTSGAASSPSSSDFIDPFGHSNSHQSDSSSRPRTYLPGGPVGGARDIRSPLGLDSTTFTPEPDSIAPAVTRSTTLRPTFEEPDGDTITSAEMLPNFSTRPTTSRSESSEGGLYRVSDHYNQLKANNASSIEDIYAKPGVEHRIIVSYRPARAASMEIEPDAARLVKKSFKVTVSYRPWGVRGSASTVAKERKTIICKAKVCTSFIAVKPKVIDFGEVELGTSIQGMISIANLSDIMAKVDLRFISKASQRILGAKEVALRIVFGLQVLSAYRNEIKIEPHTTVEVGLDMIPRRTNPSYQKQVSCHNLRNPSDSQVCLVKAANVDTRGVAYHSRFYKLLTPTGGNFVEFGRVPIHSNALRAITIQNNSTSVLSLDLSSAHPEDYGVFVRPLPSVKRTSPSSATGSPSAPGSPKTSPANTSRRIDDHGELKERVLEAIFQPAAPSAQHSRAESTASSTNQSEMSTRSAVAHLKDGTKAKATLTQAYGIAVAFKDRSLLSSSEYLDLATGPPLDARRTSPRSKRTLMLDTIVRSSSRPRPTKLSFNTNSETLPKTPQKERPKPVTPPASSPVKRKAARAETSVATSPALTAQRYRGNYAVPSNASQLTLDESLTEFESYSGHPKVADLGTWESEDNYVRRFIQLRRTIQNAISAGDLASAAEINLLPGEEKTVYIMVHPAGTRGAVSGTSRKQDGKILIHLRPSAGAGDDPLMPDIPLREVVVRWTSCRSTMELGMAHINFGQLDRGSSKEKKILIQNGSDAPLLYSVRKSGSIASGNIRVTEGRHGIIAGYGKREVTIVFEPRFAGAFEEVIHIDAVEDESEGQTVRLKAFIRRPPTFTVAPTSLSFGDLELFKSSSPQSFTITNTTKSSRSFAVTLDDAAFCFARSVLAVILDASEGVSLPSLTTEEEEEVEGVLQKLKISRRKGQPEKEEKYVARLQVLGVPVPMNDPANSPAVAAGATATPPTTAPSVKATAAASPASAPGPDGDVAPAPAPPPSTKTTVKKEPTSSSITFTLDANSRRDISIVVVPSPILPALDDGQTHEDIAASLTVSENADYKVTVSVAAKVLLPGT